MWFSISTSYFSCRMVSYSFWWVSYYCSRALRTTNAAISLPVVSAAGPPGDYFMIFPAKYGLVEWEAGGFGEGREVSGSGSKWSPETVGAPAVKFLLFRDDSCRLTALSNLR
jgi:hypothetical protein